MIFGRPRAGVYAHDRYQRGLKAYRRRMRTPLLIVVIPMFVFFWVVVLTLSLIIYALQVPTLIAFTVARFEQPELTGP